MCLAQAQTLTDNCLLNTANVFPDWNVDRCAMEHTRKDRSGWSWLQWENAFLQFMKLCVMCIPTEHQ